MSSGLKKYEDKNEKIRTHTLANGTSSNYKSICMRHMSFRLSFLYWSLCT